METRTLIFLFPPSPHRESCARCAGTSTGTFRTVYYQVRSTARGTRREMACNIWFVRLFSVSLNTYLPKQKDEDTIWRVEQLWLMGTTYLLKHCIIAWQRLHYCSGIYSYSCRLFLSSFSFSSFLLLSSPKSKPNCCCCCCTHLQLTMVCGFLVMMMSPW